jgi:hypothetical protein
MKSDRQRKFFEIFCGDINNSSRGDGAGREGENRREILYFIFIRYMTCLRRMERQLLHYECY